MRSPTVTVGLDGSRESLAAAGWAAGEAALRGAALRLVHVGEQRPSSFVPFAGNAVAPPGDDRSARMLREVRDRLAHRHPGLRIGADRLDGRTVAGLVAAAEESGLLVLGSRGLGLAAGFLFTSVASAVVARAGQPVILVSAAADGRPAVECGAGSARRRDVVLGLHVPHDAVLGFAFDAASRRSARLRVIHDGDTPPPDLVGVLRPWREKYPDVEVTDECVIGRPGTHLTDASRDASLVVVGRRTRHAALGLHIGPVTQAVLQYAVAPVAVIPHD
ncbi:universal stress protein [Streptomyces marokkonensis]|uniref:universal stress protein n=1 Tax=Streptomyces marokkonensis TaxID=324855 RepID=UPI0011F30520|nr:universal stress protein [Streptomyces marokkonensis]